MQERSAALACCRSTRRLLSRAAAARASAAAIKSVHTFRVPRDRIVGVSSFAERVPRAQAGAGKSPPARGTTARRARARACESTKSPRD